MCGADLSSGPATRQARNCRIGPLPPSLLPHVNNGHLPLIQRCPVAAFWTLAFAPWPAAVELFPFRATSSTTSFAQDASFLATRCRVPPSRLNILSGTQVAVTSAHLTKYISAINRDCLQIQERRPPPVLVESRGDPHITRPPHRHNLQITTGAYHPLQEFLSK